MRQKINENPVVQAALVGLLVVAFAFLFMTRVMGGGSEPDPSASDPATAPATSAGIPATDAAASSSSPSVDPVTEVTGPAESAASGAPAFKAGKGLPSGVVEAHDDGQTVVVLAFRVGGSAMTR